MCKGICKGYEFKRPKVSTHLYLFRCQILQAFTMWLSLLQVIHCIVLVPIKVRSHPTIIIELVELKAMQLKLTDRGILRVETLW